MNLRVAICTDKLRRDLRLMGWGEVEIGRITLAVFKDVENIEVICNPMFCEGDANEDN